MASADAAARVRFIDLLPAAADPAAELRAGLAAPAPWIAPKFFYDALGARLFEAICELPEYTLPRDEQAIFDRYTNEIAALIGPDSTLIDLGAGNCAKAERLFTVLRPAQYVAVDIAGPFLLTQLELLARRHRTIDVIGIAADFSAGLVLPPMVRSERRVIFYPGSSIGNFAPEEALAFLSCVHDQCAGGHLLIGADLVKDPAELVAAYDDALGVTASFNLNVLNVVNRLGGDRLRAGRLAPRGALQRRREPHRDAPGGTPRAAGVLARRRTTFRRGHSDSHRKLVQDDACCAVGSAARGRL